MEGAAIIVVKMAPFRRKVRRVTRAAGWLDLFFFIGISRILAGQRTSHKPKKRSSSAKEQYRLKRKQSGFIAHIFRDFGSSLSLKHVQQTLIHDLMMFHVVKKVTTYFCLMVFLAAIQPARGATIGSQILDIPFPYSDTPNIIETSEGLLMVWASGTREGYLDVKLYRSHWNGRSWTAPQQVAAYADERSGIQEACWNPVLIQGPEHQLALFYQVGSDRASWEGRMKFSYDGGHSWTPPKELPKGFHGPVKNKSVELPDGKYLCPSSQAVAGWQVQLEFATPFRENWGWRKTKPLNSPNEYRSTDPAILMHDAENIQVLNRSKQGYMTELWTHNGTKTWSEMKRGPLPNPNSAFDVIKIHDGRFVLVYNHSPRFTDRINLAVSSDGKQWEAVGVLDQAPSTRLENPSIIQSRNGHLHLVYVINQNRFKHVRLDPTAFQTKPIVDGAWPVK